MSDILDELWKLRNPKDALLLELINGYYIKESEDYPDDIFYMKEHNVLIDYDLKTKIAWINNQIIWSVFESKFSLNNQQMRELMRGLLETHLKLIGTTPRELYSNSTLQLERHLNLKGSTPIKAIRFEGLELETHPLFKQNNKFNK